MKKADEILSSQQEIGYAPRQSENLAPTKRKPGPVWKLWLSLGEAYGSAFTTQFGDKPSATWLRGLDGYSEEELKRGFDGVLSSGNDYAPSLAVIRKMIAATQTKAYHRTYNPHTAIEDRGEGRLLPAPQDNRTTDQIRKDLKLLFKGK